MFGGTGLFHNIPCPKGTECDLLRCIFSHTDTKDSNSVSRGAQPYDPAAAGIEPTAINLDDHATRESEVKVKLQKTAPLSKSDSIPRVPDSIDSQKLAAPLRGGASHTWTKTVLKSSKRPVSPPPGRNAKKPRTAGKVSSKVEPEQKKEEVTPRVATSQPDGGFSSKVEPEQRKEELTPRMVTSQPDGGFSFRLACLKQVHAMMTGINEKAKSQRSVAKAQILSDSALVGFALDEEQSIAEHKRLIYRGTISSLILKLKKMQPPEWTSFIEENCREKGRSSEPVLSANVKDTVQKSHKPLVKDAPDTGSSVITGLSSIHDEMTILRQIQTHLEGLEKYGYVTSPPSAKEIEESRRGVEASAGAEICDRCGSRFRVFPGRDENGNLTSGGSCSYHWGKVQRTSRKKTDRITGQQEDTYPCCGQGVGSEGCQTADTHVFKVTDVKRLASNLQFKETPDRVPGREVPAVTFDCEMAYTALGMEVIRVTAVSWPLAEELLDVLVRPQGEILDLNTRFSGVSRQLYASALPYGVEPSEDEDDTSEEDVLEPESLRIVESPACARELLFELLTPDTPLLGHAIENDLNVCRIIHPFVIDTVLLFKHPRGLPIRYSLKVLASRYLNKGIQMGGDQGHDSKEDAVTTGELVGHKVKETWTKMKHEGWVFDEGKLISPED